MALNLNRAYRDLSFSQTPRSMKSEATNQLSQTTTWYYVVQYILPQPLEALRFITAPPPCIDHLFQCLYNVDNNQYAIAIA